MISENNNRNEGIKEMDKKKRNLLILIISVVAAIVLIVGVLIVVTVTRTKYYNTDVSDVADAMAFANDIIGDTSSANDKATKAVEISGTSNIFENSTWQLTTDKSVYCFYKDTFIWCKDKGVLTDNYHSGNYKVIGGEAALKYFGIKKDDTKSIDNFIYEIDLHADKTYIDGINRSTDMTVHNPVVILEVHVDRKNGKVAAYTVVGGSNVEVKIDKIN